MADTTKLGFILFYFIFIGFLFLVAPYFGDDFIDFGGNVIDPSDLSVPAFNLLDPFAFWGNIALRFSILLQVSSTNIFLGIFTAAMSLGFFWIIIEWLRGI